MTTPDETAGSRPAPQDYPRAPDKRVTTRNVSPPETGNSSASTLQPAEGQEPAGDVKSLVAYIDQLAAQQPKGNTQQEQLEDFLRIQQQRLAACKKVLAMKPDKATKQSVVRAMYEVYNLQGRLGLPGAKAHLQDFAKSLALDADPDLAQMGRHIQFSSTVSQMASQPITDGKEVLAEVRTLLDADKGTLSEETLELASQAGEVLLQSGLTEDAAAVADLAATAAAGDVKLAEQADKYSDRAHLMRIDLGSHLEKLLTDQPGAEADLIAGVKTLLASVKPSREVFSHLQQVTMYSEVTGHFDVAKACLDMIEEAFKDVTDPQLKETVARTLTGGRKRMGLIGQPFVVEGVTLDGQTFDWSAYRGKVVLVDFWATWCVPCLDELPRIRSNYEQFQSLGFDVVGVNLNTDLKDVQQFFTVQELPWTTVMAPSVMQNMAGEDWSQLPMAAKYGVDAIPFLVLVGKDGNVDSLHVRGPKLKARLTQLLGEPPAAEIPADPTAPGTSAAPGVQERGAIRRQGAVSPVALLMAQALFTAEPDQQPPTAEDTAINPYRAKPGQSATQLVTYIEKMLDKPKSIQSREGFAEAIVDACDRILSADPAPKDFEVLTAVKTKLTTLHQMASDGKEGADEQLMAFVEQMQGNLQPEIVQEVAFFRLERRVIEAADGPADGIPALLAEVSQYLAEEKLTDRHLRLASSTVGLINKLEDGDQREQHFAEFGALFARSTGKELARYGKKLAKKPAGAESDLVGQTLALAGVTAKGAPLNADSYRGKVVLVDFWATWCGPCRRQMPAVQEFYETHHAAGLEIIGVSLDQDQDALAQYLEENEIPWENLAGDETQKLAEKYGIRGIPTMLLVDRGGKIVAVAHQLETLAPQAEKLLTEKAP